MFEGIHNAIITGYKDNKPLWMTSPDESVFCVISKQDVESKSDQELQDLFKGKHIVIHDQFTPTLSFDEKGLQTLGDLYRPVTIQGVLDLYPFLYLLIPYVRLLQRKHIYLRISPPEGYSHGHA